MPDVSCETTYTLREHAYSYFHLQLISSSAQTSQPSLDEITLRQHLTSALTQFLGFTGGAVSIDVLKVEASESWVRVQREDGDALMAALSQWSSAGKGVSLRVVGRATWLGGLQTEAGRQDDNLWSLEG